MIYKDKTYSNIRVMRVLVFYDLPTTSEKDKKIHASFRNFLVKNSFFMIQNSIYCFLARNRDFALITINKVKQNTPKEGNVRLLLITEKQYEEIEILTGEKSSQEKIINLKPIVEI